MRRPVFTPVGFLLLAIWALALYRPWAPLPFEGQDFSEFLPLLRGADSFAARQQAMAAYYASQGRYIPLTILYTNVKWTLFGWNVQAWQWLNVALMLGNMALAYAFVRRVGASRAGAMAGIALYVVGCATGAIWARVHYSEPQGLPFLIGAAWLAAGLRSQASWTGRAAAVAALMCVAVLTKETFVAALPFIVLLAATHDARGAWRPPRIDRRLVGFTLVVGLACVAAIVPILLVKLRAAPTSYAAAYAPAAIGVKGVALTFRAMFFPMAESVRRVLPEMAFYAVIALGLVAAARRGARAGLPWLLLTAFSLPLGGALAHASWPIYTARYAAPYALGLVMLLAVAVTWALRGSRGIRYATMAILGYLGAYGTLRASEDASNFARSRVADMQVLEVVQRARVRDGAAAVVVPVADPTAYCDVCWLITDFGRAVLPAPPPPVQPVSCAAAPAALANAKAPTLLVVSGAECASGTTPRSRPRVTSVQVVEHRFTGRPGPPDSIRTSLWLIDPRGGTDPELP